MKIGEHLLSSKNLKSKTLCTLVVATMALAGCSNRKHNAAAAGPTTPIEEAQQNFSNDLDQILNGNSSDGGEGTGLIPNFGLKKSKGAGSYGLYWTENPLLWNLTTHDGDKTETVSSWFAKLFMPSSQGSFNLEDGPVYKVQKFLSHLCAARLILGTDHLDADNYPTTDGVQEFTVGADLRNQIVSDCDLPGVDPEIGPSWPADSVFQIQVVDLTQSQPKQSKGDVLRYDRIIKVRLPSKAPKNMVWDFEYYVRFNDEEAAIAVAHTDDNGYNLERFVAHKDIATEITTMEVIYGVCGKGCGGSAVRFYYDHNEGAGNDEGYIVGDIERTWWWNVPLQFAISGRPDGTHTTFSTNLPTASDDNTPLHREACVVVADATLASDSTGCTSQNSVVPLNITQASAAVGFKMLDDMFWQLDPNYGGECHYVDPYQTTASFEKDNIMTSHWCDSIAPEYQDNYTVDDDEIGAFEPVSDTLENYEQTFRVHFKDQIDEESVSEADLDIEGCATIDSIYADYDDDDGHQVEFTLNGSECAPSSTTTVTFDPAGVTDHSGNPARGEPHTWTITLPADSEGPTIFRTVPASPTPGYPPQHFYVIFNEFLGDLTGNTEDYVMAGGECTPVVSNLALTFVAETKNESQQADKGGNNAITFDVDFSSCENGDEASVAFSPSLVKDLVGNASPSDGQQWTFIVDHDGPGYGDPANPEPGSVIGLDAQNNPQITIYFSQTLDPNYFNDQAVTIGDLINESGHCAPVLQDRSVTDNYANVYIDDSTCSAGDAYSISIAGNLVKDMWGNASEGETNIWYVGYIQPTLQSADPANGSSGDAAPATITLGFDFAIADSTVDNSDLVITPMGIKRGGPCISVSDAAAVGKTVTFSLMDTCNGMDPAMVLTFNATSVANEAGQLAQNGAFAGGLSWTYNQGTRNSEATPSLVERMQRFLGFVR